MNEHDVEDHEQRQRELDAESEPFADELETEELPVAATDEEALPSAEEVAELRKKAAAHDELETRRVRAAADYANSTKRLEREMRERSAHAIESFAGELLVVADDIARAIDAAREHRTAGQLLEGLEIVEKHLYAVLERHGVTLVETAPGETFDPEIHEAVSVLSTDEYRPNSVVQEIQRGFRIHERLLRPARVVVSGEPEADS